MFHFLASKSLQALFCKGWNIFPEIAKTPVPVVGKGNNINPVPMYVAIAYWSYCAEQKNPLASTLMQALASGHLLTLLDDAYGVQRTPQSEIELYSLQLAVSHWLSPAPTLLPISNQYRFLNWMGELVQ